MYSFNAIWGRIRSLQRRLAKDLAIIRLRRLAQEFCDDYEEAVNDDPPASHLELDRMGSAFIPSIGKAGFRLSTFMALRKYLERCLTKGSPPLATSSAASCPGPPRAASSAPPSGPAAPSHRSRCPGKSQTCHSRAGGNPNPGLPSHQRICEGQLTLAIKQTTKNLCDLGVLGV